MRVLGKGSKERTVPVGVPAARAVRHWQRQGRPRLVTARSGPALFLGARGGRLDPRTARRVVHARIAAVPRRARHRPARPAPLGRHPPAGGRGRPEERAGDSRPRIAGQHPDLHACLDRAAAGRLPPGAPEGVSGLPAGAPEGVSRAAASLSGVAGRAGHVDYGRSLLCMPSSGICRSGKIRASACRLVADTGFPGGTHLIGPRDGIPRRGAYGRQEQPRRASALRTGARQERDTGMAPVVTMRQLLESGVHFGHQTRRWNPKMKRFIFTERNGIYIIDLQQSLDFIDRAYEFIRETVAHGGSVLYVGTKKQAQEAIAEQARRVGMPFVNQRWLGGMLTNFATVYKRLQRLKELEEIDFDDVAGSDPDQEGAAPAPAGAGQARAVAGRHQGHGPGAERALGGRHQEGAHRGQRGAQAGHSGDRDPGHQLRPRRGHLPDPRQR